MLQRGVAVVVVLTLDVAVQMMMVLGLGVLGLELLAEAFVVAAVVPVPGVSYAWPHLGGWLSGEPREGRENGHRMHPN